MNPPTLSPVGVECIASDGFKAWLANDGGSLILSTYQAGKVASIGWDGRQLTLLMRQFDKPLGLALADDPLASQLVLATRNDVSILSNARALASEYQPGRSTASMTLCFCPE